MIPRNEILFTLAMAEKGLRSETPPEVMAELCRVYLAWRDAPEMWISPRKEGELASFPVSARQAGREVKLKLVEVE